MDDDDFRRPLESSETELVSRWEPSEGGVVGDVVERRINWLTQTQLRKVGTDPSGWNSLFLDDRDGRHWELTYPESEMHGAVPNGSRLYRARMRSSGTREPMRATVRKT
jgi:hypothetical protein